MTEANAAEIWGLAIEKCSGLLSEHARQFERTAISAPNRLVVVFRPEYTLAKSVCQRPENTKRLRAALAELTGQNVEIDFQVAEKQASEQSSASPPSQAVGARQQAAQVAAHPLVRRATELFDVEDTRIETTKKTN